MIGSVRRRHHSVLVGSTSGAITATGSEDTRTVLAIVVLLAVVGIGLAMLSMWVFRVTRPDRELLAPLEVMGDRTWRRGDPVWQRRRLDEVRPPDAAPFRPTSAPPAIDESYDAGPTAPGFEDLSDPDDGADGADGADGGAPAAAPSDEIDNEDDTIATALPTDGEALTDPNSGSDADMASETSDETGADAGRLAEAGAVTDAVTDGAADDADEPDAAADDTIDGGAPGESSVLSDDVSSTPPDGVTRSEFVAASPSADPDATLADLVAAAEEPAVRNDGSDDPVRSGE